MQHSRRNPVQNPRSSSIYQQQNVRAYYSPDSTARQLAPEPRQPQPRQHPKPRPKRGRRRWVREQHIEIRWINHIPALLVLAVFISSAILVMSLRNIYSHSLMQIESLRVSLYAQNDINEARTAEILASVNMAEIEYIARTYLDMIPPEDHQIVEIFAPAQSFFAHESTVGAHVDNSFSFNRLWQILTNRE